MNQNNDFQLKIRVYYEDTDAGGVVYHSQYLNFFERARTEWLRTLGYDQGLLREQQHMIFVVRQVLIDFQQPAKMDDELVVSASVDELKGASIHFYQTITRASELLSTAKVHVVCLEYPEFSPKRIPQQLQEELSCVYQC